MRKKEKIIIALLSLMCIILFCFSYIYYFEKSEFIFAQDANASEVQQKLKDWCYYNGPVNGVMDATTREAIRYFQRSNGLSETGNVDGATANSLGIYMSTQQNNDLYLLAKCIHAEARGEVYEGKVAVGAVILNRVKDPNFPNTIYGVIYQPWAFTAVHDGQIGLEPDGSAYQAAQDAMNGWDPSYGSIYYYNPTTATSSWIFSRQTVVVIGKHVFAI